MNKFISTDPHCFLTVIGPSGSGKNHKFAQLLRQHRQIFKPNFELFVYFYNHFHSIYEELLLSLGQKNSMYVKESIGHFLTKLQHQTNQPF